MFIITQDTFFYLGLIICIYYRRNLIIQALVKEKRMDYYEVSNEFMRLVITTYIVGVISKVYFPLTIAWGEYVNYKFPIVILNPIKSIMMIYSQGGIDGLIYNIGGNIILLTPMGFFLSYCYRKRFYNGKSILMASFIVSLFIEVTQVILSLVFPNVSRYFEVNDIILNTFSGLIGFYIFSLGKGFYRKLIAIEG